MLGKNMIKVSEVMTKEVQALHMDDPVEKACNLMALGNFRHIPVLGSEKKLIGLISHRDLLRYGVSHFVNDHLKRQSELDQKVRLKDIMSSPVKTVHPNDSLRHCGLLLQSHRYGCLPVVVDGQLVGIVTDTDFVSIAINLIEVQDTSEDADMIA